MGAELKIFVAGVLDSSALGAGAEGVLQGIVVAARAALRASFPTRDDDLHIEVCQYDRSFLVGVSNDGPGSIVQPLPDGSTIAVAGYTDCEALQHALDAKRPLDSVATSLPGCFSLIHVGDFGVTACTDASASNMLYRTGMSGVHLVSSRASTLASILTQRSGAAPRWNLRGMRHFAIAGYFPGEHTPFAGIDALAPSVLLRIDPWYTRRASYDDGQLRDIAPGREGWKGHVVAASDALVSAFNCVPKDPVKLTLTGGRDSRILAAALSARGDFSVHSSTLGVENDPDVVIAQKISSILGFEHTRASPPGVLDGVSRFGELPSARIERVLDVFDGMVSAWDDIEDYGPLVSQASLSGVGGEIARGGLVLPGAASISSTDAARHIENALAGGAFFTGPSNEAARALVAPLIELARSDPHAAIDDFYYFHRNARWVAARRSGSRFRRYLYDPLLDNQFVRLVRAIPAQHRWSERLMFDVIATLEPRLRDVPIEGARWRFELEGPDSSGDADERDAWARRYAMARDARTQSFAWQRLSSPRARAAVHGLVAGRPAILDELFDPGKLTEYLAQEPVRYPTVHWHLATLAQMVGSDWLRPERGPKLVNWPLS
ncbi:hypothetical protein [Cellulosimicrobium sp. SJTW-1]|uniref:hypothetical protein n=1 Tax=Cellulosimicrobium sp. SJTW-1 TaxID=3078082 RepID=UPI0039E99D2D